MYGGGQCIHTVKQKQTISDRADTFLEAVCVRVTLDFSTASSILSTMAESNTCRSHDALLMELTGWLFNHEVISDTFSALQDVQVI